MKYRHRMPTIFSIYMVDVLCCALGCAILLWLVNYHDSRKRAAAVSETGKRLAETRADLDASGSKVASLDAAVASLQQREQDLAGRLASAESDKHNARKHLRGAQKDLADLKKALDETKATLLAVEGARDQANQQVLSLRKDKDEAGKSLRLTEKELADLKKSLQQIKAALRAVEGERDEANQLALSLRKDKDEARKSLGLTEKELAALKLLLNDLEAKVTQTNASLKNKSAQSADLARHLADLRARAKDYETKLSTAEIRSRLLEDDLAKGRKTISVTQKQYEDLLLAHEILSRRLAVSAKDLTAAHTALSAAKKETLSLADKARLLRELVEHRFAGITLTGQKVLFLVDMSGSMELLDENTPDPDKWPLVCATVAQIMQSLPDLRQYQVILFSDKVRYPFGNTGRWLDYSRSSPKAALDGLKAVKPNGETDMAAAFEEAFRFRGDGLDTIYVLSDGLPNAGPGIPFGQRLTEQQKTEHLSKYVRNRLKNVLNRPEPGQRRVRINAVGYFFESPDVGAFLWALAREHDGSFVGMSK